MADSKAKSLAGQIQLLMGTEPDFPRRFKQRLVLESSRVANPVKFIVELFSKGVLCDRADESGASFGLKETMVQLALLIVSSKGADAMGGLMEAFEESGNSQLVSELRAWVVKDFDIQTDRDLNEAKGDGSAFQSLASEMTAKPQKIPNELSSSGPKLIDKLMSHEETHLMEQLEAHFLGKVSKVVNADEFCSSLVNLNVLDESDMELKPEEELEPLKWTEKAIKAACSKKATGSLIFAFDRSGNEHIIQETLDWLETPKIRQNNYPISVKTLASQRSKEEPTVAMPTFFEQAACPHGLSKLATFKCHQQSATKGISVVQFDQERMMACGADGTLNMWNWQSSEEEPIKIAANVKNITCFQYDEEILVLGTAHGSVHLFDMRKFEEKSSVKLNDEAVISLKFVQSTIGITTAGADQVWWVDISRPDMRLLNQRCLKTWGRVKNSFLEVHMFPDTSFVCGPTYVDIYETESGKLMKDERNLPCYLVAGRAGLRTWKMGSLASGKSVAVAGGQNGAISIWNTSKLSCKQYPTKTFRGHDTGILSLCLLNGHLLSLDKNGDLLMFSGHDLEKEKLKPIPRILLESSIWTDLAAHERWFATWSCNHDIINIWTVPDLWLRTA